MSERSPAQIEASQRNQASSLIHFQEESAPEVATLNLPTRPWLADLNLHETRYGREHLRYGKEDHRPTSEEKRTRKKTNFEKTNPRKQDRRFRLHVGTSSYETHTRRQTLQRQSGRRGASAPEPIDLNPAIVFAFLCALCGFAQTLPIDHPDHEFLQPDKSHTNETATRQGRRRVKNRVTLTATF